MAEPVLFDGEATEHDAAASMNDGRKEEKAGRVETLLEQTQQLADEISARPNLGLHAAPIREIERLAEIGLLTAVLPVGLGGLGLGTEPGSQRMLLRVMAAVGGADLALGRLFEGHVNGLLMVIRYGNDSQRSRLAQDCRDGMLSAVWNTGTREKMRLWPERDGSYRFEGAKTFATGAAFVRRPIVTADLPGWGWQMTMPQMETLDAKIDRSFWHPMGMESSESFGIDFTGERVEEADLIGSPEDFYRDPLFRGGAVRFAAVQAGAAIRLHVLFTDWLHRMKRGDDPYQLARLGEVAMLAQQAALWVEKASEVAEECLFRTDGPRTERMVECANMTRLAIERICTKMMQLVTAGVGARGLLQPERFERVIRDMTMYLRQPAPDQAIADVGRVTLQKAEKSRHGAADGFWSEEWSESSLPPEYFRRIYENSNDPWDFQTSSYEAGKYQATLESLPRPRYRRGLEVGCSIGVLTEQLAARCDALVALDVSESALGQARQRLGEPEVVDFRRMQAPKELPEGPFDLIVISEVAYYWHMSDLMLAATKLAALQGSGAHLILVHWTPRVSDYPLTGDVVHNYWTSRPEWHTVRSMRRERFRLDLLERL